MRNATVVDKIKNMVKVAKDATTMLRVATHSTTKDSKVDIMTDM